MSKIVVGRAEVELIDGEVAYVGNPMAGYQDADSEQTGTMQKFRVTTTDGLNHVSELSLGPLGNLKLSHL
jgi:hypothetical protein